MAGYEALGDRSTGAAEYRDDRSDGARAGISSLASEASFGSDLGMGQLAARRQAHMNAPVPTTPNMPTIVAASTPARIPASAMNAVSIPCPTVVAPVPRECAYPSP